jgi:6-phosphofructokinase 1
VATARAQCRYQGRRPQGRSRARRHFVGFRDGWKGLTENLSRPLDVELCPRHPAQGGTILGTSRTNPYKIEGGVEAVVQTLEKHAIDVLVAIGGDDTLGVAHKLSQEGVQVVGVPKTIDNDLSSTDVTFGFHTAVQIATDAIDRLHTTAESHNRVFVCEVMGRHAGWIAMYAGIAGGAAEILIPEVPFDIDAVVARIKERHSKGRYASIVVVAEGAVPKEGTLSVASGRVDAFGHAQLGGIGQLVSDAVEERTGYETRVTVLGHIQRGGTPTAYDRVLATRFGLRAMGAVHEQAFGKMVALKGNVIDLVPLGEAVTDSQDRRSRVSRRGGGLLRLTGRRRLARGAQLAPTTGSTRPTWRARARFIARRGRVRAGLRIGRGGGDLGRGRARARVRLRRCVRPRAGLGARRSPARRSRGGHAVRRGTRCGRLRSGPGSRRPDSPRRGVPSTSPPPP